MNDFAEICPHAHECEKMCGRKGDQKSTKCIAMKHNEHGILQVEEETMNDFTKRNDVIWAVERKNEIMEKFTFGKWKSVGDVVTPGGTPYYVCGKCGGSGHLHGVEYPRRKMVCEDCGTVNSYPWEKTYEEACG